MTLYNLLVPRPVQNLKNNGLTVIANVKGGLTSLPPYILQQEP